MADDKKIGAYICKGCGLGKRLDAKQLVNIATREGKAGVAKEHDFLCSAAGVEMIQNDINNEGVNRVVIDRGVVIPEGLVVGEDPEFDAKRFRRTDKGVCLITQPMVDALKP